MNRKGLTLAALAAALGLIALAPGNVGARGEAPPCPKKTLCVWEDASYQGVRVKIDGRGISNEIAQKLDDQASSVYNRRGDVSYLYTDQNGEGESFCIEPKDYIGFISGFNDVASSSKLTKKNHCPA